MAGTAESEDMTIRLAWAALINGAAFDGYMKKAGFEIDVTEALSSIDWSPVVDLEKAGIASGHMAHPVSVLIDSMLQGAIDRLPKDGVIALAVSARVPGIALPCGGIMWAEEDPEKSPQIPAGPMSFAKDGLCVWAQQGGWCAVAECAASDMAAIAQAAQESGSDAILDAIVLSARARKVKTLLAVADATGAGDNAGGVAFIVGGEESILSLKSSPAFEESTSGDY